MNKDTKKLYKFKDGTVGLTCFVEVNSLEDEDDLLLLKWYIAKKTHADLIELNGWDDRDIIWLALNTMMDNLDPYLPAEDRRKEITKLLSSNKTELMKYVGKYCYSCPGEVIKKLEIHRDIFKKIEYRTIYTAQPVTL